MPDPTDRLTAALAGRYRIERELGAGGMATVYLAEDLKHDRKVAIKVLKPELAAVLGAERFVQEIKTTAAMSHPHILPLFDSGGADGFLFYVMPYIQGETIREKLNRETQFGVDDAVRIAREVADALDYAHRHGVIHRDIKPENILLHDGRAMVMDFGIALAVSAAAGGRMTETGLSLGTPHYMSPEQATAEKEITGRSDQYSLASVLYEMLAGQPPHNGGAAQQVIMKIITEQAQPVHHHRKNAPTNVDAALAKALEKLPADRFESAAKFAEALGTPAYTGDATAGAARSRAAGARASLRALAAVAGVALIAIVGWVRAATRTNDVSDAPVVRVPLDLPAGEELVYEAGALAISPAGDRLAYVTRGTRGVRTIVRRTDEFAGREVAAVQFNNLAFSPDGKWLVYSIGAQIRKIPADGGASTPVGTLADPRVRGLAWSPLDTIVAGSVGGLWALPAAGGAPRKILPFDSLSSYNHPIFLEDGLTVAFGYRPQRQYSRLGTVALGAGAPIIGDLRFKAPLGVHNGWLVYVGEEGTLLAVRLDASTRAPIGDPVQLDDSILAYPRDLGASAVLSASGTLAYVRGLYLSQLIVSAPGRADIPLGVDLGEITGPRYSPDGRKVLFSRQDRVQRNTSAFVFDIAARTVSRVTNGIMGAAYPDWFPDGKRIVFHGNAFNADRRKDEGLWSESVDGSSEPTLLYAPSYNNYSEVVVAPDGRTLAYRLCKGIALCSIESVPLGGGGSPTTVVPTSEGLSSLRLSPDGRWVAYHAGEGGNTQVYVRPYPTGGARIQISDKGGTEPQWARSGRAIAYRSGNAIVSVAVSSGTTLSVGERRTVLTGDFVAGVTPNYDITPDGSGYLVLKPAYAAARPVVVHNWARELREKLAAGKR